MEVKLYEAMGGLTVRLGRIAVSGKGGCGKSVVTALLAKAFRKRGLKVLVVDADESNRGLYWMLGFKQLPTPLMELAGGRQGLKRKMSPKTFLVATGKSSVNILDRDVVSLSELSPPYLVEDDGLKLLLIGKINRFSEGCACPMGFLSREFLGKLRLKDDEVVLVDTEAGLEHFGRGVEANVDSMVIVTEPSLESIRITEEMSRLAAEAGIKNIYVVLNKVPSENVALKLMEDLGNRGVNVAGFIRYDPEIFEACLEGKPIHGEKAEEDVEALVEKMGVKH